MWDQSLSPKTRVNWSPHCNIFRFPKVLSELQNSVLDNYFFILLFRSIIPLKRPKMHIQSNFTVPEHPSPLSPPLPLTPPTTPNTAFISALYKFHIIALILLLAYTLWIRELFAGVTMERSICRSLDADLEIPKVSDTYFGLLSTGVALVLSITSTAIRINSMVSLSIPTITLRLLQLFVLAPINLAMFAFTVKFPRPTRFTRIFFTSLSPIPKSQLNLVLAIHLP
jgi:hypothetical protein